MTITLPKLISFALVVLALYGDLVKRVLPPTPALMALYAAASTIIVAIVVTGRGGRYARTTPISFFAGLLTLVYLAQFLTTFSADLLGAFMAAGYVCVPLAFLVVIPRVYPNFDLRALAFYTTLLIIPVHAIGLIQRFINPSFLISTAYSGDLGGVILRNFLDAGIFERFPSIFASADRYSGVAMIHIFLTFFLLTGYKPPTQKMLVWVAFNLMAGGAGLLIAGARSRIIIVVIALAAAGIAFLINARRRPTRRMAHSLLSGFVILAMGLAVVFSVGSTRKLVADFPVLTMLEQTVERGDVRNRLKGSIGVSQVPDDVTIFGKGLGVTAGGRPGEFAVRAMWIESGLFWTLIMLLIHVCILFSLGRLALRAGLSGNPVLTLMAVGQMLAWLLALLAGLSSTFELSQALLLFPIIAVLSMLPGLTVTARSVPMMPRQHTHGP